MKRFIHATALAAAIFGIGFSPGCALFVHEKEVKTERSGDGAAKVEHSESTKQTEVRDTGIGESRKEVQMEHRETRETVR